MPASRDTDIKQFTDDITNPDFETEPLTERKESNRAMSQGAPEDKGNKVYLIFFLYGFGILLPFNAILTALDFFEAKVGQY